MGRARGRQGWHITPTPLWSGTDSPSLFAQAVGRDGNAETHNECEERYSL